MTPEYRAALVELLYQLADDELTIGHRDSEWTGFGPIVEEDVAMSSIAQDEMGHGVLFFGLLEGLGEGTADALAYARPVEARRNAILLERPNGGWDFSMARHFLYDQFEAVRYESLTRSGHPDLAAAAEKIRREEKFHLMHSEAWVRRLAQHGGEARGRIAAALQQAYPAALALFEPGPLTPRALELGILPEPLEALQQRWEGRVQAALSGVGLTVVGTAAIDVGGRRGKHSGDLVQMLEQMTEVYRLDPTATW